jgi:hypothetical protein
MQLSRDVLQHCSAGGLNNFSDVVICSILSLRPELKSGELAKSEDRDVARNATLG